MIYNDEYAQRVKAGKGIPVEKWTTYKIPYTYTKGYCDYNILDRWLPKTKAKKVKLKTVPCVICGNNSWWMTKQPLCFDCYKWANDGQKNKTLNLFAEDK